MDSDLLWILSISIENENCQISGFFKNVFNISPTTKKIQLKMEQIHKF